MTTSLGSRTGPPSTLVLASALGQTDNLTQPDGLQVFFTISRAQIEPMGRETHGILLIG